jgi:hypothetical protein
VSGNPSGRPKRPETIEARRIVADVKAAAQELTQEAIDTLKAVMKDPKAPPSARVSAATAILDRGHGKPHQAAEVTQTVAMDVRTTRTLDVSHITDMAELAALERALNSTIARLEGTPFNSRERTIWRQDCYDDFARRCQHAKLTYASGVEMPRQIEAEREAVPVAGGAGL